MKRFIHVNSLLFVFLLFSCQTKPAETTTTDLPEPTQADTNVQADKTVEPDKKDEKHFGIDVSHFQGDVVARIKKTDDLAFMICKATEGANFVDPMFQRNWSSIKAEGLVRGTYHFYDCAADPKAQAQHFHATVAEVEATDIAPILDIEQGSMQSSVDAAQMIKDIQVFLNEVEKLFGRKPILYTDYAFAQQYFKEAEGLAGYALWLAEYSKAASPQIPDLWKEKGYFIWQKSASYDEASTQVDYDEYKGDLKGLTK